MTTHPDADALHLAEAVLLYRTMRTDELRQLRRAFELDRAHAPTNILRLFCDWRIALIDRVLVERN